ncbi:MAG: hypothetical protein KDF24_08725 [Rhodocyclaceae bacterium]|nr:hypothetical protein [Rhodocyclaceae bacterium]MCB1963236.1 hypothetical protein [Rhodocyclaceae bacterium]
MLLRYSVRSLHHDAKESHVRTLAHALALSLLVALSAAPLATHANPQHQRMRDCNKSAKEDALKGDARKAFMKTCLSGKHTTAPATETAPPADKPAAKPQT